MLPMLSWTPCGFTSISTINSFPMPNGMSWSMTVGGDTRFWVDKCSSDGSHETLCKVAMARSQMGSEKAPQVLGKRVPPNV
jgi:hypothetical protein